MFYNSNQQRLSHVRSFAERQVKEALSDTPVVLLVGPRRAGKTTLAQKMQGADRTYLTLDNQTTLEVLRRPIRLVSSGVWIKSLSTKFSVRLNFSWRSRRR